MLFFLTAVLGYDIWFYLSHLLLHTRTLYRIHSIHHQKIEPKWYDTYRGHWFETVLQGLGFFVPLLIFDMHWLSFLIALLFVNIRGIMRHDDRCSWLVGNHHLIHHKNPSCNFGEEWLDKLCSTYGRT
jgi:sterol desaturase/sphingolipid hydroxylase (fatty acid hydroxylase superfamily)